MIHSGEPNAAFFDPLPVFPGNAVIFTNQTHSGDSAQADNDFGADDAGLHPQPVDACILLFFEWVPIVRWAALDNIGDIIVIAVQVDD